MQRNVAAADTAQRPADALLDEVARIRGGGLDRRQAIQERGVGGVAIVQRQRGQQRESGPLDELGILRRPLVDFRPGVRRAIEQLERQVVADRPVVEIARPPVHLRRRQTRRIGDEGDEHPCFIPTGLPQRLGEVVALSQGLAEAADVEHRDAEDLFRDDGVPRHAVPVGLAAMFLEPAERGGHVGGGIGGGARGVGHGLGNPGNGAGRSILAHSPRRGPSITGSGV
jgi:hypothetical protein